MKANSDKLKTWRFVKSEDLNHHGTLFAGRAAEWFVETGLMTTCSYVPADQIVLVNIDQMSFYRPIKLGSLIECTGQMAYLGKTSFIVYISFKVDQEIKVEGFISYVNVDENTRPLPHGLELEITDENSEIHEKAKKFLKK